MRRKAIGLEILWLLGCCVVAFLLLGALVGYRVLLFQPSAAVLDIQLHNTYFVLDRLTATLPLFGAVALAVTSGRVVAAPLRTRYTGVVLLLLLGVAALVMLLIKLAIKRYN